MAKTTRADGRVTLRDVAAKTGYTVNTVSRALRGSADIAPPTREIIRKAAREAGYIRNWLAGSLRTGRTDTIALVVGDLSNPFFALMVSFIEDAASALGYTVIVLSSHETSKLEERAVRVAIGRQADGVILCPCQEGDRALGLLQDAGTPYALVSRYFEGRRDDALVCDEVRGGYLATEHLIRHGHKKLCFLSSFEHVSGIAGRKAGFLAAAREYGIPETDSLVYHHAEAGGTAAYLSQKIQEGFTGAFAYCDMEAWKIITRLLEMGVRVPLDMAFAACDNIQGKLDFPFPLCSVEGHLEGVCRGAVDLLDAKIRGAEAGGGLRVFPVEMICRSSCGAKSQDHPKT